MENTMMAHAMPLLMAGMFGLTLCLGVIVIAQVNEAKELKKEVAGLKHMNEHQSFLIKALQMALGPQDHGITDAGHTHSFTGPGASPPGTMGVLPLDTWRAKMMQNVYRKGGLLDYIQRQK